MHAMHLCILYIKINCDPCQNAIQAIWYGELSHCLRGLHPCRGAALSPGSLLQCLGRLKYVGSQTPFESIKKVLGSWLHLTLLWMFQVLGDLSFSVILTFKFKKKKISKNNRNYFVSNKTRMLLTQLLHHFSCATILSNPLNSL